MAESRPTLQEERGAGREEAGGGDPHGGRPREATDVAEDELADGLKEGEEEGDEGVLAALEGHRTKGGAMKKHKLLELLVETQPLH